MYAVAKYADLDQSYVGRVEKGVKGASRETVIRIGFALVYGCQDLEIGDIDQLLLDANYAPLRRER